MRYTSFLVSIATVLMVTNTAIAAAPPGVSSLQAEFKDNGKIAVSWQKIKDENIDFYRIYYSANSILENDGIYDDFESTDGNKGLYVFDNLAPDSDVYVAILAVNTDGEESEFFSEEILIHTPANTNPVPEPSSDEVVAPDETESALEAESPTEEAEDDHNHLQLLGSEAISPTEVRVDLSRPIIIRPKESAEFFFITTADESELSVVTAEIREDKVVVHTEEQVAGTVYEMHINQLLEDGHHHFSIDNENRTALFTGHPDGKTETVAEEIEEPEQGAETDPVFPQAFDPNLPPQKIENLHITQTKDANGLFNVSATWKDAGFLSNVQRLVVGQSFDGGKTYSEPQFMPGNSLSANIQGVPAGDFGLFVQSMDSMGRVSDGASASITLGSNEDVMEIHDPALPASPTSPTSHPENDEDMPVHSPEALPKSGTGFILLTFVFAGALLGWRFQSGLLKILPIIR